MEVTIVWLALREGAVGSAAGALPLSSGAAQSPAQSFVPLTVRMSLQPIGACGLS
jgi:hypothetical protein